MTNRKFCTDLPLLFVLKSVMICVVVTTYRLLTSKYVTGWGLTLNWRLDDACLMVFQISTILILCPSRYFEVFVEKLIVKSVELLCNRLLNLCSKLLNLLRNRLLKFFNSYVCPRCDQRDCHQSSVCRVQYTKMFRASLLQFVMFYLHMKSHM